MKNWARVTEYKLSLNNIQRFHPKDFKYNFLVISLISRQDDVWSEGGVRKEEGEAASY